jgi:hypothetical protein
MSVPQLHWSFIPRKNQIKSYDATIWYKESLVNYVDNTLKNIESVKYSFIEREHSIIWVIEYGTQMFDDFHWLKKSHILNTYYNSIHEAANIAQHKLNLDESENPVKVKPDMQKRMWANIHIELYFDTDNNEYILYFNKYNGSSASFYYVYSMFE